MAVLPFLALRPRSVALVLALGLASTIAPPVSAQDDASEAAVAAEASEPDILVLKDGSRIVGKIVGMASDVIEIQTDAADGGTLKIKFHEIASIEGAHSLKVLLTDGTTLIGTPNVTNGGRLVMSTELGGDVTVDLGTVKAINPPPVKPVTHKGRLALTGKISDGNTRNKQANALADYEMRTKDTRLTLHGNWTYAEDDEGLSARNAAGSMKYDYFFTSRVFGYVNALFEGDDFADLNLRTTLGAGSGYQFLDRNLDPHPVDYYQEIGISFFDEDFDMSKDERYAAGRIAGKADWTIIADRLEFFHVHEVYFGFEDEEDIYADTRTGIRFPLIADLSALVQVNFSWDNTPASGARRTDTEYLWGVLYTFNF